MKKPIVLLLMILGLSLSVASAWAGPKPDLLGFTLGMTSQEALARAAALKLLVQDPANGGRASVPGLPNSEHRYTLTLTELGPQGSFTMAFSAPPEENRLIHVARLVDYKKNAPDAAPSAADLKAALIGKFGKPTNRQMMTSNIERLTWYWAADGRLLTKELGSSCRLLADEFVRFIGTSPPTQQKEKLIRDGCALRVQAEVTAGPSGVVDVLSQRATDVAGGYRARSATYQAVQDFARRQGDKDLQRAKQRKPAI